MSDSDAQHGAPVKANAAAGVERRLAAIVSADVVGYSRLMGADETGTLARLKAHRQELIDPTVVKWHGRIVKLMGDGILIEFASAVDAVSCAVEIQQTMRARNEGVDEAQRIVFRIGINLGDIIIEGEDIYGDGVNIAARLEALAEPGSVYISEDIYRQVRGKLDFGFDDLGTHRVKNIAEPVKAYRVAAQVEPGATLKSPGVLQTQRLRFARLAVAGIVLIVIAAILGLWRPWEVTDRTVTGPRSIAVLPFANMSADPEQEYFADGITDDLITDLSKLSSLLVIARNAAFVYKGQNVNPQQVAEALGVRYVLEGSVRKAGGRIRINAQLIDSVSGGHLWAERYDRRLTDIFDLQDEVTGQIVTALKLQLTESEQANLARRYTNNLQAYDYFLQGQERFQRSTWETSEEARALYREALALDPAFGRAYAGLAVSYAFDALFTWAEPEPALAKALEAAERAVVLDDTLAQAHWAMALIHMLKKQPDQAIAALQRTIELAPSYADAYLMLAWVHNFIGRHDQARQYLDTVIRLSPRLTASYYIFSGMTYYWLGQLDQAVTALQMATERNPTAPNSRIYLTAAYVASGRQDNAEWEVEEILNSNPAFSLERWLQTQPYTLPSYLKRLQNDLRQAGFSE